MRQCVNKCKNGRNAPTAGETSPGRGPPAPGVLCRAAGPVISCTPATSCSVGSSAVKGCAAWPRARAPCHGAPPARLCPEARACAWWPCWKWVSTWFHRAAVSTSALHAEGPGFVPRWSHRPYSRCTRLPHVHQTLGAPGPPSAPRVPGPGKPGPGCTP